MGEIYQRIILTEIVTKSQKRKAFFLYQTAFPKSEKKPISLLKDLYRKGYAKFYCIEDEKKHFLGILWMLQVGEIAMIDYFAICEKYRSCGIGAQVLKLAQEMFGEQKLLLEIEDTTGIEKDCSNLNEVNKLKRKEFYLRNGMRPMDYRVCLFGVNMEILVHDKDVSFDEYYGVFEECMNAMKNHVKLLSD